VDRRLSRGAPAVTADPQPRSPGARVPLGSVALAIPITAVAASDLHGIASVVVIVVSWIGIVAVNAAHALGQRHR
jgi:hypothetical protein